MGDGRGAVETRTPQPWPRVGAACGLVASGLLLAGVIVGDVSPEAPVGSSSDTIAAVLVEHRERILVGTYLTMLGAFFLVGFAAFLRGYLLAATGERNWLVAMAFGGGLVSAALLLVSAHVTQSFTVLTGYGADTQVAKTLYVLDWNEYLLVEAPPLAALVGATSALWLRERLPPRWLGWTGALVALSLLSPVLPGSGVLLAFLWIGVLSVLLVLRPRPQPSDRPARPVAAA